MKNRPVVVIMTVIILISLISCGNKPDEIIDVRDNAEDQENYPPFYIKLGG